MAAFLGEPAQTAPVEIARALADHGFSVMPLRQKGKRPLLKTWKHLQAEPATPEQVESWGQEYPGCNWGVLTSPQLAVIDCDNRAAYDRAREFLPNAPTCRTGKGWHIWLRPAPGLEVRNSAGNGLDVRGDGGYVVGPGSVHLNGQGYEFEPLPAGLEFDGPDDLPLLTAEHLALIHAYQKGGAAPEPAAGVLFNTGQVTTRATGAPVAEGSRNNTAASLAGQYIQAGDSLAETMAKVRAWNNTNPNPLGLEELERTVASVARTHVAKNPGAAVPVMPAQPSELVIRNWGEFEQNPVPKPEHLIGEGLVDAGGRVLIAGPPKAGKSTLALALMGALATGGEFLEFRCARPVRCAWLNAEIAEGYVGDRVGRLLKTMSEEERALFGRNFFFTGRIDVDLLRPTEWNQVLELLRPIAPEVIVLDPIINLSTIEENSNSEARGLLRLTDQLQAALNCTVLIVHHSGKGSHDRDPFEAGIRGATAFRGWYDAGLILMKKGNGPITLAYDCRNAASPPAHGLTFDEHGRACKSFLPAGGKSEGPDYEAVLADIRKFLAKQPVPLAKTTVTDHHCEEIGHSSQTLRAVVSMAQDLGDLGLSPHPERKRGRAQVLVDLADSSRQLSSIDSPINLDDRAMS